MFQLPPLSLYIHFPWCLQKCPYCDFNSHTLRETIPEKDYIQALLNDFEQELIKIQGRALISIYFGGGTPSLLSDEGVYSLLNQLRKRIEWQDNIEITLEANPGSVDSKHFKGYYEAGINRLSIGIQSFNDEHLKRLGRIHDSKAALQAIQIARASGFNNFNIDLMFGLPKQSYREGLEDLKKAIALSPPHLSWYQLTLEPHTPFFKNPPQLPHHDAVVDLYEAGLACLNHTDLNHYEISAFSRPGFECRHNLNYWSFGDYIGIGAGAHSKITRLDSKNIERYWKKSHPKAYLNANDSFNGGFNILLPEQLPFEFMLNALRAYQMITRELFEQRTGLKFKVLVPALEKADAKGLLEWDWDHIALTNLGKRFYNDIVSLFL
jgi:oxygen-independent coproporphyrinogen-3 oxidase